MALSFRRRRGRPGARLFLLYATPRRRSSPVNPPPQRQCELFVSRNVSAKLLRGGAGGENAKWKAIGGSAPAGVTGVDRWPIYRRGYRVNRRALSNATNSIRTPRSPPRRRQEQCITRGSNLQSTAVYRVDFVSEEFDGISNMT